jgi:hypothetical protein
MRRWLALAGFISGIGAAAAEPVRMSADDIKHVMQPGAVLAIDTPLRISIPVKVEPNGMVAGEAGALGLTLGAMKDRGRWWTENEQLCMKWFRWFDAKPRCITLKREGNKVYWYENSGEAGTASITEAKQDFAVAKAQPEPRKLEKVQVAAAEKPAPQAIDYAPRIPVSGERRAMPSDQDDAQPVSERVALGGPMDSEPVQPRVINPSVARAPAPKAETPKAEAPQPAPRRQAAPKAPSPVQKATAAAIARKHPRPGAPATATTSSVALASFRVSRVVDGDMLNVRSGPSEYHEMVGAIPARGRGVQIVGACRELWCPIRHGNLKGWVNRYYLAEDVGQATYSNR